jgi:c(7)-type cytochrome triheme protein
MKQRTAGIRHAAAASLLGLGARALIAPIALIALTVACSGTTRQKVLGYVFDGVPGAAERAREAAELQAAREAAQQPEAGAADQPAALGAAAARLPAGAISVAPSTLIPPPIPLTTWQDVLDKLPVDALFGLDWIAAVRDQAIRPVGLVVDGRLPEPPFSLDDLALFVSQVEPGKPVLDLDLRLRPAGSPFYEVEFPHSGHTLWLNCASCHPHKLPDHPSMKSIFRGESCGGCHGKVAFAPEFSCFRCHPALRPPTEDAVREEIATTMRPHPAGDRSPLVRGRVVYEEVCVQCHGRDGDGKGPLAEVLSIQPRDLRAGDFRFRSTVAPSLPTDEDLFTVISRGVPNSSMPAFATLPAEDRWALVEAVKSFSPRFLAETARAALHVPAAPEFTAERAARGREVYFEIGCDACHGAEGGGDGRAAPVIRDALGFLNPPLNFQSGRRVKSGQRPQDIYRVIMTGLEGTPMPGFVRALSEDDAWSLVAFVAGQRGTKRAPWTTKGDIVFTRAPGQPNDPPPAVFPHWKHRSRLKCSTCHPALFQMKVGTAQITMDGIRDGQFCGKCHTGRIAWETGFETCGRCHLGAKGPGV